MRNKKATRLLMPSPKTRHCSDNEFCRLVIPGQVHLPLWPASLLAGGLSEWWCRVLPMLLTPIQCHARHIGMIIPSDLLSTYARLYRVQNTDCSTALPHTPHWHSAATGVHRQHKLRRVNRGQISVWHLLLFGKGLPLFWGVIKRSYCSLSFCWHESDYSYQGSSD